ncbi:phosphatase PAP2 family protein [Streptomyces katrae]|uniref:Phosphatase PAP2 family protein n=1 Tax=Streptomyces katrae TaxID=68223 RepID=A0ABT7GLS5_9ACTN|nr:phosphatase PAP2 family protein [Streptomyces katrae]MDK9494226.1 phosphatase PAP2 family protein [Streptomyces katrae]
MTSHTTPDRPPAGKSDARRRLIRELLLVAGLFAAYKAGRTLSTGRTDEAFRNAGRVWDAERALHLPGEGAVQRLLLHSDALVHTANTYYAAVHFPATALFLVWLYLRRPAHYLWTRRVLAVLTAAALVLHLSFPLAPPRMLDAARLVDTAQVYGPSVYGAAPETDTMANQFAAMPSLHFGWALMLALGMIAATRSRWRALWLLHPLATLLVVVGTANHYWVDAAVATLLLGTALLLVPRPPAADAAPAVRGLPRPRRSAQAADVGAGALSPGAAPAVRGAAPTSPGTVSTARGVAPTTPGAAPTTPGAAPTTPGAAPAVRGAAPLGPPGAGGPAIGRAAPARAAAAPVTAGGDR